MSRNGVSEGAAFLLQCLDSSACKLDWKVIGDAMDLNPGTASMRLSRLKSRAQRYGTISSGKAWSGELDQDSTLVLQCIISSDCKIDFKKVGTALNLQPGTASMRFTRMRAKYWDADVATTAAPVSKKSSNRGKRKVKSTETDSEAEPSTKKQKTEQASSEAPAAVKEQESEEDEEEQALPEKRQTRGKQLDFKHAFVDSDNEARVPVHDGSTDDYDEEGDNDDESEESSGSDEDWSNVESEDEVKPRRGGTIKTPRKIQSTLRTPKRPLTISPITPIGYTGIKMWQGGRAACRASPKAVPPPIIIDNISDEGEGGQVPPGSSLSVPPAGSKIKAGQGLCVLDDTSNPAGAESFDNTTVSDVSPCSLQLRAELADHFDSPSRVTFVDEKYEEDERAVMQSIEVAEYPQNSFLGRLASWWR